MTDAEFWNLVIDQKGAALLAVAAGFAVAIFAFIMRGLAHKEQHNPEVILSRCKWELRLVRDEISRYPATREVHEICDGIDSAEETIDRVRRCLRKNHCMELR